MMTPMSETPMRPVVEIDPNVRVRGNGTYAGLEDVIGPIKIGGEVTVRRILGWGTRRRPSHSDRHPARAGLPLSGLVGPTAGYR